MPPLFRRSLRTLLVTLLLGSVLLQVLLPMIAEDLGGGYAETSGLVVPYALAGIVAVVGLQVVLGAVWWLVTRADRDEVFTPRALRGVDIGTAGVVLATVLAASPMAHLLLVVGVGGPGVVLMLGGCLVGGAALVLVARATRTQLVAAIADRADLEAVVPGTPSRSRGGRR